MKFFAKNTDSHWIGYAADECSNFQTDAVPAAPWLRREFEVADPAGAQLAICGLGYYEVYLNGKRVGDRVLDPMASVYDKHVRYVVYDDIAKLLKKGRNCVGIVLGTGWYDCYNPGPWVLEKAPWRDLPKVRFELKNKNGRLIVGSDEKWKFTRNGPIVQNALRLGEWYDARLELGKWSEPGYDDSAWRATAIVRGPGGLMERETAVPIRIVDTQILGKPNRKNVYDLGRNISGHARITVRGEAGAEVILQYTERIAPDGDIDQRNQLFEHFDNTYWQYDKYTLKGSASAETWEARFTYHGFQYVRVTIKGRAKLEKIEARIVNTDFKSVGSIRCGNDMINTLQTLTRRSYLANFVGIPTDCPHREKNGWTGDAELASETGLLNFDAAESYKEWIGTMRDCQRPNGDLPGIVPTGGWGYNWGNGPAWDCALFVIPWNVFLYTGDDSALRLGMPNMKRYLDFMESVAIDHIVQFGLGDWCSAPAKMVDPRLTNTAIYYGCLQIFIACAKRFGFEADAKQYAGIAASVAKSFHKTFYKGGGVYADGELTAMGTALYFDLCPTPAVKAAALKKLAESVEACGATAQFGIIGAKFVPRVLADNGYAALAGRFFTQENFPGWAHWVVADGATSLHENWGTGSSWNHIMFGDLSAWLYKYPGGFRFSAARPGWKRLVIQPCIIPEWKKFRAEHRGYVCEWSCMAKAVKISVTVPEGCTADVILPDGSKKVCGAGLYRFSC